MTCEEVEIALASDPRAAREEVAVRAHLEGCEGCREASRAFERIDAALEGARQAPAASAGLRDRAAFLKALCERIDRDAASGGTGSHAAPRTPRRLFRIAAVAAVITVAFTLLARVGKDEPTAPPPAPQVPPRTAAPAVTTTELCVRLRSSDAMVKREALEEIGRRSDTISRSLLVAALRDPDLATRAAELAGTGRVREAIPALSRLAKDTAHGEAAIVALGRIGGHDAAGVLLRQFLASPRAGAASAALRDMGTAAVEVLQERVLRARRSEEEALLEAVVALRATACLPWVVALAERSGPLQRKSIAALGALGDARATGPLIRAWRDPSLRAEVRSALASLGEPGVNGLVRLVSTGRGEDRARAIETLGKLGDKAAVGALLAFLADPALRSDAVRALGEAGDPSTAAALAACLDDPSARSVALEALEQVADVSTVPLLEGLARNPSLRRDVLRILGRTGAPAALPALLRALASRETAAVAAEGLVDIGEPAVPGLIRALSVREVAPRARGALVAIASVDLGSDPCAWQRWWSERTRPENFISSGVGNDA